MVRVAVLRISSLTNQSIVIKVIMLNLHKSCKENSLQPCIFTNVNFPRYEFGIVFYDDVNLGGNLSALQAVISNFMLALTLFLVWCYKTQCLQ